MKTLHSEKAPKALGPYSQAVVAGGFVFAPDKYLSIRQRAIS